MKIPQTFELQTAYRNFFEVTNLENDEVSSENTDVDDVDTDDEDLDERGSSLEKELTASSENQF